MFFICRRSEQRPTGLSCCLLTAVFFLFRVCVKKSTQERLALKILIDRPKARNEVRGNIAVMVINVSCVGRCRFALVCLPARYQSSLINSWFSSLVSLSPKLLLSLFGLRCLQNCLPVANSVSRSLSMSPAAFCFDQAAYTAVRHAVKTSNADFTHSLNRESCHRQANMHKLLPLICFFNIFLERAFTLDACCVLFVCTIMICSLRMCVFNVGSLACSDIFRMLKHDWKVKPAPVLKNKAPWVSGCSSLS